LSRKNEKKDPPDLAQAKKYAQDLSEVYKSEKEKRKELKTSQKQLMKYAEALSKTNKELKERNEELKESYLDTIHRLVLAAEFKDEDTGDHIVRISRYCALIAEKLDLPARDVQNLYYATQMHDVGKIGIPDDILMKPGKLTGKEFYIMTAHTTIGAKILTDSKAEILQVAEQIAISHHEKWDGKGYPHDLAGDKIPLVGRIVGIADTFDALTSKRPYKDPYPVEVACDIIRKERGHHFDPEIVDVFLENIDEIKKIKVEVDSSENVTILDFAWSERDRLERAPL